jgi:hypothetical protein
MEKRKKVYVAAKSAAPFDNLMSSITYHSACGATSAQESSFRLRPALISMPSNLDRPEENDRNSLLPRFRSSRARYRRGAR